MPRFPQFNEAWFVRLNVPSSLNRCLQTAMGTFVGFHEFLHRSPCNQPSKASMRFDNSEARRSTMPTTSAFPMKKARLASVAPLVWSSGNMFRRSNSIGVRRRSHLFSSTRVPYGLLGVDLSQGQERKQLTWWSENHHVLEP